MGFYKDILNLNLFNGICICNIYGIYWYVFVIYNLIVVKIEIIEKII